MTRLGRSYPVSRISTPHVVVPPAPVASYDNSAKSTAQSAIASGTAFTWTETIAPGACVIVAIYGASSSGINPSNGTAAITVAGASLTAQGSKSFNNNTSSGYIWVFLLNGVTGGASQTISATLTKVGTTFSGYGASYSYTNITGVGSFQGSAGSSTNPSFSATASASSDIIWGSLSGGASMSAFSLTGRQSSSSTPFYQGGDTTGTTSATVSATASLGNWCGVALDLI